MLNDDNISDMTLLTACWKSLPQSSNNMLEIDSVRVVYSHNPRFTTKRGNTNNYNQNVDFLKEYSRHIKIICGPADALVL